MRRLFALTLAAAAGLTLAPAAARAQAPEQNFLAVGEMAPDFELRAATRYGVLAQPIKLSDFRGETVVLAFFYRVRGGG